MDDLPAPLARDLVGVDHDSMDLRIQPVFEPLPWWMGWLPPLVVLPVTLFVITVTFSTPDAADVITSVLLFQGVVTAFGAYVTWDRRPTLELALGMHRLELRSGKRIETISLADLQKVKVTSRQLWFLLRDGREITLPLPERSSATARALDELLQKAQARGQKVTGEVPAALRRLVAERDQASR
jgi:hypothetical protein